MSHSPSNRDLRSLFCEQFACPLAEFEERVFRQCLYPHARIIAPLLRSLNPSWFQRDLLFAHYFGNAKNGQEITTEIDHLCYQDRIHPRFSRNTLRLRISGRKAHEIAVKLLQSFPPVNAVESESHPHRQVGG
jgi:hypothetical protein